MTDYSGYTREELIKEIGIWRNRASDHAIAYAEKQCQVLREYYSEAYARYLARAERYDWVIALLAKFGIKEKTND